MILLKSNQLNKIVVTLTQNTTVCDPEYLFQFVHIFSKENVAFILPNVSPHPTRYDEFQFVEGQGVGQIPFPYEGQYNYYVYAQPFGSGNLNPLLASELVENGISNFIIQSADTTNEYYVEFISDDEFDSNIIFAPDEINPPTPSNTQGLTPTPTPSITASPTQTITPTMTQSPTKTGTPTPTPTITPSPSSAPFDPLSLGNLQHWYLSTSGASASSWTNLGLLGGALTQSNPSLRPSIITDTLGSFSGAAVNYTEGENQFGSFALENYSGACIFMVLKRNSIGAQNWTINLAGSFGTCVLIGTNALDIIKTPTAQQNDPPLPSTDPILIASSGQSDSFFSATYNDQIPQFPAPVTGFTDNSDFLTMGADTGQTGNDTSIFEFIIYNRLLTSSEYAQVVSYLKTKYQYNTW